MIEIKDEKAWKWLLENELSYKIWNNKYRYNNESFDEWLDRISAGNEKVKKLIFEKKFLFGGRTLANRGTNRGSMSNCFVAGVKVLCKRGLINIEDIVIGDEVLSDDGNFHKVNDIMHRDYSGDLYKIISNTSLYDPIICTPNHKFLTNHGWKRADRILPVGATNIKGGQDKLKKVFYSTQNPFSCNGEGQIIDISKAYIEDDTHRLLYLEDGRVQYEVYHKLHKNGTCNWQKEGNPVNRYIELTPDFMYFIGRWLGDGSITRRRGQKNHSILQIVFNKTTEKDAADRCIKIGEIVFGIKASIRETDQNIISVRFESPLISSWFYQTFGEKCDGKFIPNEFLGNLNILFGLIDSDGYIDSHGTIKIVLKNFNLLNWIKDTCYLNGINCGHIKDISYRQQSTGELYINNSYANKYINLSLMKSFYDKNHNIIANGDYEYVNTPTIEILEDQSTTVYNISVEDTHTYTVNGVIVHNCYSSGFCPDDLSEIMNLASDLALTYKAQGGQGVSLSKLRPKGTPIGNRFESDGIVPFMEIFNKVTESISQGGSRKGALLMSLDAWHKEIETFITIKKDPTKIQKANLSVEIDDEFMKSISIDKDIEITRIYEDKEIQYTINPSKIYNLICESALKSAEPGVIFTNRFRNYNLMEFVDDYQIETCNPCGEQPLIRSGSCNLSSINVSEYIIHPFTKLANFNWSELRKDIKTIVAAMDDILEENLPNHALEKQKEMVRKYRNCGIGIMGLHDAFIKMGITYGSSYSVEKTKTLMNFIFREALQASVELAETRGSFPGYSSKIWDSTIIKENIDKNTIDYYKKVNKLRNCSLLSIAPCGSIATMLNISTGIEPWFALHYTRNTKSLEKGKETSFEVWAPIAKQAKDLNWHPECLVSSNDISWKQHIDIQAAGQSAVDTAISKTINMPKETTLEDVKQLYLYAWKSGLKGCTIYVDGSRDSILTTNTKPILKEENTPKFNSITPVSRKKLGITSGSTYCKKCSCGTLYITCNRDQDNNLVEIFTHTSKGGICQANLNAETRMASLALRSGVKVNEVIDQLKGITCPACIAIKAKGGKVDGISCADIIAKTIQEFQNTNIISHRNEPAQETEVEKIEYEECPECHEKTLIREGGCRQCTSCGYSKCE